MKNIKTTISFVVSNFFLIAFLFTSGVSGQILKVSSVLVDSCWNSDSTWNDGNGILQKRTSRDCLISFTPQGEGKARMFIFISVDSGKTWTQSPDTLRVMNKALDSTFTTGKKATITVRVLGGDRPGTVFKMTARQAAPVIAGYQKNMKVGLDEVFTTVQALYVRIGLRLADTTSADGFCTISKVYWDALVDGTIDDSTTGANVLFWKWWAQVPAGALGQKRSVIAKAMDKNGLWSTPETLSVQFGVIVDSVTDIDGNVYHVVQIGNQQWTMENLRVTRYNDGTAIPKDTSIATWANATTPKYCYYSNTNDSQSIKQFGALYNWWVVDPANSKKLAPVGWHIPSDSEWTILEKYLVLNGYNYDGTSDTSQINKIAKSLATQMGWSSHLIRNSSDTIYKHPDPYETFIPPGAIGDDLTSNNNSGFSALGGGCRNYSGGFVDQSSYNQSSGGYWWSSTSNGVSYAWYRSLGNNITSLCRNGSEYKSSGLSVRLVRD